MANNMQTKQNLLDLSNLQGDISKIMSNMLQNMIEKVEDNVPLARLTIKKKRKSSHISKPVQTFEPIIERKYDIVAIDENVDEDMIIEVESLSSDKVYIINLTKNTCSCPDFFYRVQKNPEHICKHLKKHFENIEK